MLLAALSIIPHCVTSIQVLHCVTAPVSNRAVSALQEAEIQRPGAHTLYELTIISLVSIPRSDRPLSQFEFHYTLLSCPQNLFLSCSSPVPVPVVGGQRGVGRSQTPRPPCLNMPRPLPGTQTTQAFLEGSRRKVWCCYPGNTMATALRAAVSARPPSSAADTKFI